MKYPTNSKSKNRRNTIKKIVIPITAAAVLGAGVLGGFYLGRKTGMAESQHEENQAQQATVEVHKKQPGEQTIEELLNFDQGYTVPSNLHEEDSFSRYSPIFQSFMSPQYASNITKGVKGLERLAALYDGDIKNGEAQEVLFVNDGRPYNLVYKIKDKDGKVSYGFESISKQEADKLEEKIWADAEKKVDKLFSKQTIYFNADFMKALINGEGGEGRLQSRLTVFTHALAHLYQNTKTYALSETLRQLTDCNITDNEIAYAKLEKKGDGTGDFYLGIKIANNPQVKELNFHYSDPNYFEELTRVLKIVAKEYQFRHPSENIEDYQR